MIWCGQCSGEPRSDRPRASDNRGWGTGAAAALALLAFSCSTGPTQHPSGEGAHSAPPVRIVASIAPIADLARRVAGEEVEVLTLVPPGASEHTWEPAPRDAERLAGTEVFFRVGLGFESWAAKLVSTDTSAFTTVDASVGVDLIDESGDRSGGSSGGAGSELRGAPNPHYWLDPLAMRPGVLHLAEALAQRDPDRSEAYRARAARTVGDLEGLDAEIRARTSRFRSRKIVTFHAAWDYFARRYGLVVLGSIEEFPGKDPGPRHIEQLVHLARAERLSAVFAEPQLSPKAAEVIAAECGVPVLILDPLGGESVQGRSDYFSLMRYNVGAMEQALR